MFVCTLVYVFICGMIRTFGSGVLCVCVCRISKFLFERRAFLSVDLSSTGLRRNLTEIY